MTAVLFDVADMVVAGNALNLFGIYMFISAYSYALVQHTAHHAFQAKNYSDEKCSPYRSLWRRFCTILLFCFIAAPVATFSCARGTNWISLYDTSGTLFAHGLQLMPNSAENSVTDESRIIPIDASEVGKHLCYGMLDNLNLRPITLSEG